MRNDFIVTDEMVANMKSSHVLARALSDGVIADAIRSVAPLLIAQAEDAAWKPFADAPKDGSEIRVFDGKDDYSIWWVDGEWYFYGTSAGDLTDPCCEARIIWPPLLYREMPKPPSNFSVMRAKINRHIAELEVAEKREISAPTNLPVIEIVELPNWNPVTHGGRQDWRQRELRVNGVVMEKFIEGGAPDYHHGEYFDQAVKRSFDRYKVALIDNAPLKAADPQAPPAIDADEPLAFSYRNHRGEVGTRRVMPSHFHHGATEWHIEPQWLLSAYDLDKQAQRDFAVKDIGVRDFESDPLPCDVMVAPNTTVGKGVPLATLLNCIGQRAKPGIPEDAKTFKRGTPLTFQSQVGDWLKECFDENVFIDPIERGDRLLEEVLELLQSGGYPRGRAPALEQYVYDRAAGDPSQEVGGVKVTLAAYCHVFGLDMDLAGAIELARINQPETMEKIRRKQASKPTGSALPIPIEPPDVVRSVVDALEGMICCYDPAALEHPPQSHFVRKRLEAARAAIAAAKAAGLKGDRL